ncbi:DUF551 domain-containing protein [Citrobacter freundii]|uniref:DUF551 domain-containing protein n=1 Tax=Citrobacter freundii TaxID=546 RepID=UPI002E328098|nr:DUF551 domain-containing protein [Citrobacter freundii]
MTTNNHPAHGPVSLDRLHQISEILSKAAAQSDVGNLGCAMSDAVKVIDGAIAAFGTEPVAYMTYKGYLLHAADPKLAEYSDPTPLYTAPPAPVSVPAAMEMDDDFDSAFEHGKAVGWNAYRAAMLQANYRDLSQPVDPQVAEYEEIMNQAGNSPSECSLREGIEAIRNSGIPVDVDKIQSECDAGNSPVTPDGWVPVSDRMPDKLIPVMVMYADGEMWSAMWSGQFWDDGCTIPDPHSITHWREMPAAPKQEVKAALEHGMKRYAGAMQKLSEGDK